MMKMAFDLTNVRNMLKAQQAQVPFAASRGLNRIADKIKEAEVREIVDVFDRPTPYTQQRAIRVQYSSKADLTAVVMVSQDMDKGIPPSKYLAPQISGGTRPLKRFERALQAVGALPAGWRAVPGAAAKIDAFGNMDRGQIQQILSFFKAFPEAGYKANMTDKRRQRLARGTKTKLGFSYFVGRPGDRLPLGVWQRVQFARGSAIRPILIFVPSAVYSAIFDFGYVAQNAVDKNFAGEFVRAFDEAMRTAR